MQSDNSVNIYGAKVFDSHSHNDYFICSESTTWGTFLEKTQEKAN